MRKNSPAGAFADVTCHLNEIKHSLLGVCLQMSGCHRNEICLKRSSLGVCLQMSGCHPDGTVFKTFIAWGVNADVRVPPGWDCVQTFIAWCVFADVRVPPRWDRVQQHVGGAMAKWRHPSSGVWM